MKIERDAHQTRLEHPGNKSYIFWNLILKKYLI